MADETKELGLGVLFQAAVGNFAKDLDLVKEQLKKVVNDIEALNKTAAEGADKVAKAQAKAAEAARKAAEETKKASGEAKAGAEAGTKAQDALASATEKTTAALKEHGRSLAQVRTDMQGLAAHTTSQIAASRMSGDVYESLSKKLKSASGETIQYRTALAGAAVEAGTSTIRFNQLSGALLSNEKTLLQTEAAFGKVRAQFGANALPKDLKDWATGVDRLKLAHASLNGELFKANGIVIDTKSKFLDFQRTISTLKENFGDSAWAATEMDKRLGSYVKTIAQAKTELANYTRDQIPFNKYMTEASKAVENASVSMSKLGLAGEKWAAGVDKGSVATAFMNNQLVNANGTLLQAGKTFAQTEQEVTKIERSFKRLGAETFGEIRSQLGTTITSLSDYKNALQTASDKGVIARTTIENLNKVHAELSKIAGLSATAHNNLAESVAKGGLSVEQAVSAGKKLVSNHLDAKAATEGYASQVTRLSAHYQELLTSSTSYSESAKKVVSSMKSGSDGMYVANEELKRLNAQFMTSKKEIETFNTAVKALGEQSPKTASFIKDITTQVQQGSLSHTEATKKIGEHSAELKKLGVEANRVTGFWGNLNSKLVGGGAAAHAATDYMSKLGQAVASLAAWIPAALIIGGFTQAVTGAIAAINDFDQALKSLQAISDGTEAEISLLGKEMLKVSDQTKYSASEIAKGAIYIAQAGFTAGESLQVIAAAARGAQGTLEPLTTAADLLTTVLRAFHIDASQSAQVMDMLAMAANKSKTDLEGMKVVFNYLGPAAYSAGIKLNETLGTIMALSNVGMRMSTVGTSLRQVFIGLENPSAKLKAALKEVGLTVEDLSVRKMGSDGRPQGLVPVLQNLDKVIKGSLTNSVQFFNVRAGNAALVISQMNQHVAQMIEFTRQYGAAAIMAGTQTEGMAVKMATLGNQFQNFLIRMAEGGPTEAFKLLLDAAKAVISTIDYLVNNSFTNFLITTGLMYVAISQLASILKSVGASLAAWALGAGASAEAIKLSGVISGLSAAWTRLVPIIVSSVTAMGQAIVQFIVMSAQVSATTGIINLCTTAWNALTAAFLKSPIGWLIAGLSVLAAILYTVATSSEKYSKALQENTISYSNNASSAEAYAATLKKMAEQQEQGTLDTDEYLAVIRKVKDTFPELSREIILANGNIAEQAEVVGKAATAYRTLADSYARASAQDIVRQYREASKEIVIYTDYLKSNRGQFMQWMTAIVVGIPAIIGSFIQMGAGVDKSFTQMTWAIAQWKLAWNTSAAEAAKEASEKVGAATVKQMDLYKELASVVINSSQTIKQSLIDSIPDKEMKNQVQKLVDQHNFWVQSLKDGVSEIKAKEIDAVGFMGGIWVDYYRKQDELGQAEVAKYAILARKKIDAEIKAMAKGGAEKEELQNREMVLLKEHFQKMYDERVKHIGELGKLEDKLYEESHKRRKDALDLQLGMLDIAQKQEIMLLQNENLKEAEFITQKEAIENAYFQRNKEAIAANTAAQLASIESVRQAKLAQLEINAQLLSDEDLAARRAAVEAEASGRMAQAYKEQLAALKTHIGEKLTEFNKYKTEYDKTLKEIEKAEADHLKVVAKANEDFRKGELAAEKAYRKEMADAALNASKTIEDLEKMKRDALQLTMDYKQKAADKEKEVNETIAKGYEKLREVDLKGETETINSKIKMANDYFKEAQGMINGLVIQNKNADGQLVQDDQATQNIRLNLINQLIAATKEVQKAEESAAEAKKQKIIADLEFEKVETIRVSAEKREALIKDLTAIAEAAKASMENIRLEIVGITAAYNQIAEEMKKALEIKADATQVYTELKKLTDHISAGRAAGDYKVVLDFMGKASPEAPFSETIAEVTKLMENFATFVKELVAQFIVVFLGDATGEGTSTLASAITWVDERMTKLYNKINGMRAVFTIVTRYVTEGSPSGGGGDDSSSSSDSSSYDDSSGYAEGGPVPGSGDSDSVPAMLTPGEFVISKPAVRSVGEGFLNFVNRLKSFTVPKFAMGGVVPQMAARNSSEEVFTLNLRAGDSQIPLKVVGDRSTMRTNIRKLEKELGRMRLSHA